MQDFKLCCSGGPQSKIEKKQKESKYFDLPGELKKTVEHESDDYTNCISCSWYI